ncbi:MAG TPA: cation-transporting P-type ATPase, partial [Rhodocyclaceae bacterium]
MSLANRLLSAPDESGLSAATAAQRLRDEGYNELAPPLRRSFLMLFGEALHEPMFLLLLGAGGVYLLLGDKADALLLLGFVVALLTLTVTQEWRTSRVLDRLRDLASPRATVVRDGAAQRVPGREVVRGDLLLLAEGDRVA